MGWFFARVVGIIKFIILIFVQFCLKECENETA
jgi:hypothetical protein